jgi:hypothetical protein
VAGGLGVGRLNQARDLALVLVDTVTQVLGVEVGPGLQVVSLATSPMVTRPVLEWFQESVGGITQRLS